MKTIVRSIGGVLLIGLFIIAVSSCQKEKQTSLKVLVMDTSYNAIPNAEIKVFINYDELETSGPELFDEGYNQTSGADGAALFIFDEHVTKGQTGFVVFDVEATTDDPAYGKKPMEVLPEIANVDTLFLAIP